MIAPPSLLACVSPIDELLVRLICFRPTPGIAPLPMVEHSLISLFLLFVFVRGFISLARYGTDFVMIPIDEKDYLGA